MASIRGGAGRISVVVAVMFATVVALALPAGANTGHVVASQTCNGWSVKVTLDNNVSYDRLVAVTTTIPGTTGFVDHHYDTTDSSGTTLIWNASGPVPTHGTVTLTILKKNRGPDSESSATLHPVGDCDSHGPTTSESTSTSTTTTSTTMPAGGSGQPGPTVSIAPVTSPLPTDTASTSSVPTTPTSIAVIPTSVTSPPSTTTSPIVPLGSTSTPVSPLDTTTSTQPAAITAQQLPRTGSGSAFAAVFGLCCLTGGALLTLRHRRTIWSVRK